MRRRISFRPWRIACRPNRPRIGPATILGFGSTLLKDAKATVTAIREEGGKHYVDLTLSTTNQDGKEVECKGGKTLEDGQILGMNFYVKGIDDKFPGK